MNLLIVDDTVWNLRLLRAQLEAEGHTILEAADGLEALAVLERAPVDAVISDIFMPRMDGFALCHAIRQHARFKTLPLIVLTSTYNSPADERMAYRIGADKYLIKPAPTHLLMQTLKELVSDPKYQPPRDAQPPPEAVVLQEYNATLVRKLEEKNQDLTAALAAVRQVEAQLRDSLREKEVLLQEVHHRVKNNLQIISSLLNFQCSSTRNPALLPLLRDTQSRIKSMSLVHDYLGRTQSFAEIELASLMQDLVTNLFHAFTLPCGSVALRFDLEPVQVSVNTAIPCALILNELVSNALKHAFPAGRTGTLQVSLHPGPAGQTRLTVRDDGVGWPPTLDYHHVESLGLQLINTLARQIHGTVELDRAGGTSVTLTFPPPPPQAGAPPAGTTSPSHEAPHR